MPMPLDREMTVVNRLGLHLRAAAQLVQTASRFKSIVQLVHGNAVIDAKSIMGVMALGAIQGTMLIVRADGPDADAALDALEALFAARFGEPD